jgi:outer membrane biosynthesis protein TonB
MPRAARPKSPEAPAPVLDGPDPHMHAGKCTICKHPQRAEIERAFVDWSSPAEITQMFGLASRATIYRHARARGLFELRRRNLHFGLGRIAEQVADVKPSAANVIAAFIAMAKINARGEWDPGHRFDTKRAIDHAHWQEEWSAAREISLEDTMAGKPAPIHVQQKNLRQFCAEYDAQKAVERAETAKEAEQQAERERQAREKQAAPPPQPKPEPKPEPRQEPGKAPKEEPQAERHSQPVTAVPSNPPAHPVQEKKRSEPEDERPHPIPQPPKSAAPLIDSGLPQVAGLPWPWPRKKIAFARRGRRPVVG